MIQFKPTIVQ